MTDRCTRSSNKMFQAYINYVFIDYYVYTHNHNSQITLFGTPKNCQHFRKFFRLWDVKNNLWFHQFYIVTGFSYNIIGQNTKIKNDMWGKKIDSRKMDNFDSISYFSRQSKSFYFENYRTYF